MLKLDVVKTVVKGTEIIEETIIVETKKDLKVIRHIQNTLEQELEGMLQGAKGKKNLFGLSNEAIDEIIGTIYTVLDEEGYGILSPCDHLDK